MSDVAVRRWPTTMQRLPHVTTHRSCCSTRPTRRRPFHRLQASACPARAQCTAPSASRRVVNASLALTFLSQLGLRATAAVVDEAISEQVFAKGARSIVTIRRKAAPGVDPVNLGTGVVWDNYGHIATNYHIIARTVADKKSPQGLEVVAYDMQERALYAADVAVRASDAYRDLAVLKVESLEGTPLAPVVAGPSSKLKVGQYVYCLGAPQPDNPTLTVGILSGLNRSFPSASGNRIYGALQVDATINRENSGGPVLDSFGRMVGLATATYSTATTSARGSGINFALPMDLVREAVPNLIVYGNAAGKT